MCCYCYVIAKVSKAVARWLLIMVMVIACFVSAFAVTKVLPCGC